MPRETLFLVGYGFIGGSLLTELLRLDKFDITLLSRNPSHFDKLKSLGVKEIVHGVFTDHELIAENVAKHDITLDLSFPDEKRSVLAMLDGLKRRPANSKPAIFIHTSGTNELTTDDASLLYSDSEPEKIDALPSTAPHRWVDELIYQALQSGEYKDKARMAIMMPPLVYGIGTGPFTKISYQIPNLIRIAIKRGLAGYVNDGVGRQTNIHVADLVDAFVLVLEQLQKERDGGEQSPNLYYLPEMGQDKTHVWKDVAQEIARVLQSRGIIKDGTDEAVRPLPQNVIDEDMHGQKWAEAVWSKHSMSRGDRIRALGWKPKTTGDVYSSIPEELDYLLEVEGKESKAT